MSKSTKTSSSSTSTSKRTPAHRLLQEISTNEKELDRSVWERLGPAGDDGDDLFVWEAVLRGEGLVERGVGVGVRGEGERGQGERVRGWEYEGGRWLIEIRIPEAYPVKAPAVRFVTRICCPNVDFQVCFIFVGLFFLSLLEKEYKRVEVPVIFVMNYS